MKTSYYFSIYNKVIELDGDDHVTQWLKEKVLANHSNNCPYCRRMAMYKYVQGAVKKGLDPAGFELALNSS